MTQNLNFNSRQKNALTHGDMIDLTNESEPKDLDDNNVVSGRLEKQKSTNITDKEIVFVPPTSPNSQMRKKQTEYIIIDNDTMNESGDIVLTPTALEGLTKNPTNFLFENDEIIIFKTEPALVKDAPKYQTPVLRNLLSQFVGTQMEPVPTEKDENEDNDDVIFVSNIKPKRIPNLLKVGGQKKKRFRQIAPKLVDSASLSVVLNASEATRLIPPSISPKTVAQSKTTPIQNVLELEAKSANTTTVPLKQLRVSPASKLEAITTQSNLLKLQTESPNATDALIKQLSVPLPTKAKAIKVYQKRLNNTFKVSRQSDSHPGKSSVTLTKIKDIQNELISSPVQPKNTGNINSMTKTNKVQVPLNNVHVQKQKVVEKPVSKNKPNELLNIPNVSQEKALETARGVLSSISTDPENIKVRLNTNYPHLIKNANEPKRKEKVQKDLSSEEQNSARLETSETDEVSADQLPTVSGATVCNDIICKPDAQDIQTSNFQSHTPLHRPLVQTSAVGNTPKLAILQNSPIGQIIQNNQQQERLAKIANFREILAKVVPENVLTNINKGNIVFLLYPVDDDVLKDGQKDIENIENDFAQTNLDKNSTVQQPEFFTTFIPDPLATFTPIDINQIINRGKKPLIESRCRYELSEQENEYCLGFKKRKSSKPICYNELISFIKKEETEIDVLKSIIKKRDECNLVQCSVTKNSYFLPEHQIVKIEEVEEDVIVIDDEEEEEVLPMLKTAVSKVNQHISHVFKKSEETKKKFSLSKTGKALELIKEGLEIIQNMSREQTEKTNRKYTDNESLSITRKRKQPKKYTDYIQPKRKKPQVLKTSSHNINGEVSSVIKIQRGRPPKNTNRNNNNNNVISTQFQNSSSITEGEAEIIDTENEDKYTLLEDDLLVVKRVAIVRPNGKSRGRPRKAKF